MSKERGKKDKRQDKWATPNYFDELEEEVEE